MRNWWIRFGCFLTGYNYSIVNSSSEVTAKAVKRYTAAMIIVCIIWGFIGYTFTKRYVDGGLWGSIAGSIVCVIIIIQIERQIILSITPSKWLYFFRGVIATMMAIIGAIIIDQIIFKEDIELEKITFIEERVKKALPPKTEELRNQIASLDTAILDKESERMELIKDLEKHPNIKTVTTQSVPTIIKSTTDSSGITTTSEEVKNATTVVVSNIPNPKQKLIIPVEQNITELRSQKLQKETDLLHIRSKLEEHISSKVGFLDELEVMYSLISRSRVALSVWLIWFLFLLGLEMLVLISKSSEKKNDYEATVVHQMMIQMRKLDVLSKLAREN